MQNIHLLKRKSKKRGSYYIAAFPYPGGLPGYQKMIVLKDDNGNTTGNPATARLLLANLKAKDKERKLVEESIEKYIGNFWTADSRYVSGIASEDEEGIGLDPAYVAGNNGLIKNYFLPWAKAKGFATIRQLKRTDMLQWRDDTKQICIEKKIGIAQVNKCRLALNVAFDYAVENSLLETNPLAGVNKVGSKKRKRRILSDTVTKKKGRQPFTRDEIKMMLATEWPNNLVKTAVMIAIYLGCRIGEIQGLLFSNINFDAGTLDILTQWQESCGGRLIGPKCDSVREAVQIPAPLLARLLALKASSKSKFVFPGKSVDVQGKTVEFPLRRSIFNTELTKGLKASGIEQNKRTLHSFRHSWVSMASEAVGLETASAVIGHADVSTTRNYNHVSEEATRKAAKAVENALKAGA